MGRETILPAVPEPELDQIRCLRAIKEILEVREGRRRGDPLDAFVSIRDLRDLIVSDDTIVTLLGVAHDHTINHITPISNSRVLGRGSSGSGDAEQLVLSSDYGLSFTFAASSLKINTPQDLQSSASPAFVTVKLSGLTDGFLPYHVSDAVGLANTNFKKVGNDLQVFGGDAYPSFMFHVGNAHDDCGISFDAYSSDGITWYSSDVGSNFVIYKTSDLLSFYFATGYAPGAVITWTKRFEISPVGVGVFGTISCSDLGDGWIPYHISDALGLSDSPIYVNDGPPKSLSVAGTIYLFDALLSTVVLDPYSGSVAVGVNDIRRGAVVCYGNDTGSDEGGFIALYAAADFDTLLQGFIMQVIEDDLCIGPFGDPDALKLDAAKDLYITNGSLVLEASEYVNFGGVLGSTGYGIRDNGGIIEAKNDGGSWGLIQFPVGHIIMNVTGVNPAIELGYGTWTQVAQGQILVGET